MSSNERTVEIQLSAPQWDTITSLRQVTLFLAGQGSGKSHVAGIIAAILIINFPKLRGLIAANTHDQLNRATLHRIRDVWKDFFSLTEWTPQNTSGSYVINKKPPKGFNTDGHNFSSYHNIISFRNGAVIYIGSLENYTALDGIEVCWAVCDETKDTRQEAIKEVVLGRLRQTGLFIKDGQLSDDPTGTPHNPVWFLTSPAKEPWLNEFFKLESYIDEINRTIFSETDYFKKEFDNKLVTISSTYHNQKNLPSTYISNQKNNLHSALQKMLIYGSPFSKAGGAFYKTFDRQLHVKRTEYDPTKLIIQSWDFNALPHNTLTLWQLHGKDLCQIDEICLEWPNNTPQQMCNEFKRRYPQHRSGIKIYGDVNGFNRDSKGSQDWYAQIDFHLRAYDRDNCVPSANVAERGNFINSIFEKNFMDLTIWIGENCPTPSTICCSSRKNKTAPRPSRRYTTRSAMSDTKGTVTVRTPWTTWSRAYLMRNTRASSRAATSSNTML